MSDNPPLRVLAEAIDFAGDKPQFSRPVGRVTPLGEAFFRTGPMSVSAALVSYLKKAVGAGALKLADPTLAAELFMAMLRGHEQTRALIGVRPARGKHARAAYVALCVETFVRGFGGKDIA